MAQQQLAELLCKKALAGLRLATDQQCVGEPSFDELLIDVLELNFQPTPQLIRIRIHFYINQLFKTYISS